MRFAGESTTGVGTPSQRHPDRRRAVWNAPAPPEVCCCGRRCEPNRRRDRLAQLVDRPPPSYRRAPRRIPERPEGTAMSYNIPRRHRRRCRHRWRHRCLPGSTVDARRAVRDGSGRRCARVAAASRTSPHGARKSPGGSSAGRPHSRRGIRVRALRPGVRPAPRDAGPRQCSGATPPGRITGAAGRGRGGMHPAGRITGRAPAGSQRRDAR
jgi:hypothetical protein